MHTAIARFLQYMRVERNASDLHRQELSRRLAALADYMTDPGGQCPEPGGLTVLDLRGYVAALHEAGYAKATIARRLASLRSFFRFGQREGWIKTNPAKPLRNPRRAGRCPISFPPTISAGCWRPRRQISPWACATGPSWRRCTRPGCG